MTNQDLSIRNDARVFLFCNKCLHGNYSSTVPDGVDAELLMKVLGNPEMAALLTSLAKTMKV